MRPFLDKRDLLNTVVRMRKMQELLFFCDIRKIFTFGAL